MATFTTKTVYVYGATHMWNAYWDVLYDGEGIHTDHIYELLGTSPTDASAAYSTDQVGNHDDLPPINGEEYPDDQLSGWKLYMSGTASPALSAPFAVIDWDFTE